MSKKNLNSEHLSGDSNLVSNSLPDLDKKETHVFLSLIPPNLIINLARRLNLVHKFFKIFNPELDQDLKDINHVYSSEEYIGVGVVSYNLLGLILGFLIYWLATQKERPLNIAILSGVGVWFVIIFFLGYFLVKLPKSNLKAKSVSIDGSLNFALKELLLQNKSGSSLFEGLVSIANSNYGDLSDEFDILVRRVNAGVPLEQALENMVSKARSSYFKKAIWQLINSVKTGSDLDSTILPIIEEIDAFQKTQIQNYSRELNLWSLVYMMFSVAIPTIGSTMLVVLSVFANMGVSQTFFIGFAFSCMFIQIILIFLVKSRRPNISF